MDLEKYISSGILEAYALNELNDAESAEVREMLVKYPQLKDELEQIELGLEQLAFDTAIDAPADLKDSILDKIEVPEISSEPDKEPVLRSLPEAERKSNAWPYVAAASVAIMLFSSYMAYDYKSRLDETSSRLEEFKIANQLIVTQYEDLNNRLLKIENDVDVFAAVEYDKIKMSAVVEGKDFTASVYWNSQSNEAYLNTGNLDKLNSDQQYQLWAIVDGSPVDMGVFDAGGQGLLKMKNIANASTFAVTIEPKGGSENPSLEAMQVAGNVI